MTRVSISRKASMLIAAIGLSASGTPPASSQTPAPTQSRDAEPATRDSNAAVLGTLPFADRADFDDARRGFVAAIPDGRIPGSGPRPVWDMKRFDFLQKDQAPATVNPSLWRQAQLNAVHGLFTVLDRVYQVRGYDISNMTIVEGDTGLIVIDPLLSAEAARASLDLYYQNRPRKPVVAVIYTHSHADHFGGVKGVTTEEDVRAGKVRIIAPDGFMKEAVSENVIAGSAMRRRALYMYGPILPAGERAQVDIGLGKTLSSGTQTLIAPTVTIAKTMETLNVDGVEIVFHLTPGTEAPAEMNMYFPQFRLLNMAENVTHTMHNLYTLRGAEIRDGNAWSKYIGEALARFGDKSDALIAQHHWPTWGRDKIVALLKTQRDLYKFIHDQSVRLLNQGYTPAEIAETIKLPASLQKEWSARGYYGTLRHNAKAVYQKYLGWYDANPANLDPLPPVQNAKKFVEYMGGADAVLGRAREDFAKGEYRWVASVMKEVVFADPANKQARELGAAALEQLGYQAESAPWRNVYLVGAMELRNGVTRLPPAEMGAEVLNALPVEMIFDFIAVRVNGPRADGQKLVLDWTFSDTGERFGMNLENAALTYASGPLVDKPDASLTLKRTAFNALLLNPSSFGDAVKSGDIKVEGDPSKLGTLFGLLDRFDPSFPIVEPKTMR